MRDNYDQHSSHARCSHKQTHAHVYTHTLHVHNHTDTAHTLTRVRDHLCLSVAAGAHWVIMEANKAPGISGVTHRTTNWGHGSTVLGLEVSIRRLSLNAALETLCDMRQSVKHTMCASLYASHYCPHQAHTPLNTHTHTYTHTDTQAHTHTPRTPHRQPSVPPKSTPAPDRKRSV